MFLWKKRPRLLSVPIGPTLPELTDPPIHGVIGYVGNWIDQLPFETNAVRERNVNGYQPEALGRAGLEEILDPTHYERASWLGGPAAELTEDWPRRPDGVSLAHVATFDLNDAENLLSAESLRSWESYTLNGGLPRPRPAPDLP